MPETDAQTINIQIGVRIKRRRKLLGLAQKELGESVGVRFQQIQKYETGENNVSAARLYRLAQALDVDIEYFFAGFERGQALPSASEADEIDVRRTAGAIDRLPEHVRRRIHNLALEVVSDRSGR